MPAIAYDVTSYIVFAYAGPDGGGPVATVSLGIGPHASAFLRFYPNGTTLPATTISIHGGSSNPMYYLSYHYEQLPVIVDLLRNEKPIRFVYSTTGSSYITSSDEPVGEAES